jgi:hypothetical protein
VLHVLTCKSGDKWAVSVREHETVPYSLAYTGNVLRTAIDASFAHGFAIHWSFSEREFAAVAADVAEEPEQLAGVDPAVDLDILAPECRFPTDDRWARVYKSHGRTELWSSGGAFRGFRQGAIFDDVVKAKILDFFGFDRIDRDQYWRTFLPAQKGVDRPRYARELYVRSTWNARKLAPGSFSEYRDGPVVSPEAEAKRLAKLPMHKSAARRLKHQANDARFKAEAAARRAAQAGETA